MAWFFDLFGKKRSDVRQTENNRHPSAASMDIPAMKGAVAEAKARYDKTVEEKDQGVRLKTDEELLKIFSVFFAPNTDFYSHIGSRKAEAYFGSIKAAISEMLAHAQLYRQATKREQSDLLEMVQKRIPGFTNSILCALIFCVGEYAVVKSELYCVDFADAAPNCIALYLLLTAQKLPKDKRRMLLDVGDGVDKQPLLKAIASLQVCDPHWICKVM